MLALMNFSTAVILECADFVQDFYMLELMVLISPALQKIQVSVDTMSGFISELPLSVLQSRSMCCYSLEDLRSCSQGTIPLNLY